MKKKIIGLAIIIITGLIIQFIVYYGSYLEFHYNGYSDSESWNMVFEEKFKNIPYAIGAHLPIIIAGAIALKQWKNVKNTKNIEVEVKEFKCPNCGEPTLSDNKKCPNCGKSINKEVKEEEIDTFECDNCGEKVSETAKECPSCGVVFIEEPDDDIEDTNENTEDKEEIEEEKIEQKEDMFRCDNCGALVKESDIKCPNCGESFEEETVEESKPKKEKKSKTNIDQKFSDLNKLKKLLDDKIITKAEFDKEKKKILDD